MGQKIKTESIETIDELIDVLEEVIDEYSDKDQRRAIIRIIEFAHRQKALGKDLYDIIYWIERGLADAEQQ